MSKEISVLYFGSWNDSDIRLYQGKQEVGIIQAMTIQEEEERVRGRIILSRINEDVEGPMDIEIHKWGDCGQLLVFQLKEAVFKGRETGVIDFYQAKQLTKWGMLE